MSLAIRIFAVGAQFALDQIKIIGELKTEAIFDRAAIFISAIIDASVDELFE